MHVNDAELIEKCVSDPNFPYLISFPRTGSHWLRLIMELYFEKPALIRSFYYNNAQEFTCFHQHDLDLQFKRQRVIYLYRNPVHTVFSQLKYHRHSTSDPSAIIYWATLYRKHLRKWLIEEQFTREKLVLRYEDLSHSLDNCFKDLSIFMGMDYNEKKLRSASSLVSKSEVKSRTQHDTQVVDLSESYETERREFSRNFSKLVSHTIYRNDPTLEALLNHSDAMS